MWRPIKTAPKDGTFFIIKRRSENVQDYPPAIVRWNQNIELWEESDGETVWDGIESDYEWRPIPYDDSWVDSDEFEMLLLKMLYCIITKSRQPIIDIKDYIRSKL